MKFKVIYLDDSGNYHELVGTREFTEKQYIKLMQKAPRHFLIKKYMKKYDVDIDDTYDNEFAEYGIIGRISQKDVEMFLLEMENLIK